MSFSDAAGIQVSEVWRIRGMRFGRAPTLVVMMSFATALAGAGIMFGQPSTPLSAQTRLRGLVAAAIETSKASDPVLDRDRFVVPKWSLTYDKETTYGEFIRRVGEVFEKPASELTSEMNARSFMAFVARTLLEGEPYFDNVQVDVEPRRGSLTLLFVDPRLTKGESPVAGSTCYYLGFADVIACDLARIASVLARIDAITQDHSLIVAFFGASLREPWRVNFEANIDVVRALLRQNFLLWLIGHEVGHAVLHRDWALRRSEPLHFNLRYDEREMQADLFVAQRLERSPALQVSFAPLLLEYVEHEFRRLYRETTGKDGDVEQRSGSPAEPLMLPFHDDAALLLRAFHILNSTVARDPASLSRIQFRRIGDRFGFVQSLKQADHVAFIGKRLVASPGTFPWIGTATAVASLLVAGAGVMIVLLLGRVREK